MKNENSQTESSFYKWTPIIELIIVLATIVGTNIPLYIHTDNKMDEHRKETREILNAIQMEMKDFHGRLCAIEERIRK